MGIVPQLLSFLLHAFAKSQVLLDAARVASLMLATCTTGALPFSKRITSKKIRSLRRSIPGANFSVAPHKNAASYKNIEKPCLRRVFLFVAPERKALRHPTNL